MESTGLKQLEKKIISCSSCPRLVEWRQRVGEVKRRAFIHETYWAKPVPGFGDPLASILIVGLAPGAHGSNRTGRMFTGDDSGRFLYPALYRAGFANQPEGSGLTDGLVLNNVFITAVCRCVPPDNKPLPAEIADCTPFLKQELALLPRVQGVVALGKIAFDVMQRMLYPEMRIIDRMAFFHGAFQPAPNSAPWLMGSYHPSRQNTQTGRLTAGMFDEIWRSVNRLLGG